MGRSSLRIAADYLSLSGRAWNAAGEPVAGASVYLDPQQSPIAETTAEGSFSYAISDQELQRLTALYSQDQENVQALIVRNAGAATLIGLSRPFALQAGKSVDLEFVRMLPPMNYAGQVQLFQAGGIVKADSGVSVSAFLESTQSDAAGGFELRNLPQAKVKLRLHKSGFEAKTIEVDGIGETKVIGRIPTVLFPQGQLASYLHDVARYVEAPPFDVNRPYRRFFAVSHSAQAAFIAYSDKREDLSKLAPGDWQQVSNEIAFDFGGIGEQTLYYRVADKGLNASPVQSITVQIDLFKFNKGIVIGDGSGRVTSSRSKVKIDIPPYASHMRLAQDASEFEGIVANDTEGIQINTVTGWMEVKPEIEWVFRLPKSNANGRRLTLFCQFRTPQGEESPVYYGTTEIDPFYGQNFSFLIEGGAQQTPERVVELTINLPPNANQMAVFEEVVTGNGGVVSGTLVQVPVRDLLDQYWMPVQTKMFFTFQSPGRKEIYVKFRTVEGIESPAIKQLIQVLPFLPQESGLEINDGAPVSLSRNLVVDLNPPPRAAGFRLAERDADLREQPFQGFVRSLPYRASTTGLVTLHVQYLDFDGSTSFVSSRAIMIDPYAGGHGDFRVNGGAIVAISPILYLDIMPPEGAVEMQIGRTGAAAHADPFHVSVWQPVAPVADYLLPQSGTHTMYVRFRNLEGEISASTARSINYDPFPPGSIGIVAPSSVVYNRLVTVNLNAPSSAWKMFVSHDPNVFTAAGGGFAGGGGGGFGGFIQGSTFVSYQPVFTHQLPAISGDYRIYAQFQSFDGTLSQVVSVPVRLELFPASMMGFSINNGATVSASRLVQLTITAPPSAVGIQVAEQITDLESSPVRQLSSQLAFNLTAAIGLKTIYLRYVADPDRLQESVSGVIQRSIYLDPFDGLTAPFTVDAGALTTSDAVVRISVTVPAHVTRIRLAESLTALASASYSTLQGDFDFQLSEAAGIKTVYAQFATSDGSESPIYSRQIQLEIAP
jgi:hypothetical protein